MLTGFLVLPLYLCADPHFILYIMGTVKAAASKSFMWAEVVIAIVKNNSTIWKTNYFMENFIF